MGFQWDINPSDFVDTVEEDLEKKFRSIVITVFNQVVLRSPVDTGAYRYNHILSIGNPDYRYSEDLTGISADITGLNSLKINNFPAVYIQNNLPYAGVIEHGGYPKPVKRGTWKKGKGFYEIRSVNGYSTQAPQGVYQMAFEEAVRLHSKG